MRPREYAFDPGWDGETERLRTNESIWDDGTFERFDRLGMAPGWRCLEVGAGNGSAAAWLADRAGPAGLVVAVDMETGRLSHLAERGVRVVRADLRSEDLLAQLPPGGFDLVHARMVVQHLAEPQAAVGTMIRALRPGGHLFLEDTDSLTLFRSHRSEDFLRDVKDAGYGLMRAAGHEPRGGHFDLRMLLASELTDVRAEGRAVMVTGGSEQARHYMLWLEYLRPRIVAAGLLTDERIDAALAEMADPGNQWLSQVLISTFGRRP
ncbi:MAG: class I SAM-dependent methyltransferase [Frankiaceae bacterium]